MVVDGLDASEQDKVVLVLDAVHLLFSDANAPYIVILAIDPHVVSKVSVPQCNTSSFHFIANRGRQSGGFLRVNVNFSQWTFHVTLLRMSLRLLCYA